MKYLCIIWLMLFSYLAEPLYADVLLIQLSHDNDTFVLDNIRRGEGTVKAAIRLGGSDYRYRCLSAEGLVLEEGSFDFPAAPLPEILYEPLRQTILLQIPWRDDFEMFECFPAQSRLTETDNQTPLEKLISFSISEAIVNGRRNIRLENIQEDSQPQLVKLIDNGPDENRLTLVFVGDGYTESEQQQYKLDVENSINQILLFEPWIDYADLVNVYYIENTISNESGIGIDSPRDTIFRLYYYYGLSNRLIWSPESTQLITDYLSRYAPASFDFAFVIANDDSGPGGSGGLYPIFNLHTYSIEIAVHEFGHSFAYLADEYVQESIADLYTYSESLPNVMQHLSRDLSVISNDDIPWGVWIEPGVVFPGGGSNGIGLFEGAFYHSRGYYRPQSSCLMRGYGVGFCEVCAEAHVVRLYDFVSPIDSVSPVRSSLTVTEQTPIEFSVDLSQEFNPNIQVLWFMNEQLIGEGTHITIDPLVYSSMNVDLRVEVTDISDWIRHDPFIDGSYNPNTGRGIHIASDNKVKDSFEWNIQFNSFNNQAAKTIYVDDDAAGLNNGTNWQNAYIYLQEALLDAESSEKPVEIRVAQGVYKPDQGANQTPGNRIATFYLINNVTIKGGYAGIDANEPNVRNIELYETILSGDLKGDDAPVSDPCDYSAEIGRADNSYNVVVAEFNDETTLLDGVTITAGLAGGDFLEGEKWQSRGAGLFCYEACPVLVNCTFELNAARGGAGLYNYKGEPNLINCRFINNVALIDLYGYGGSGGGLFNEYGSPTLTNCIFEENFADSGAGIHNYRSNPIVRNCSFVGNYAEETAGGMYNKKSNPIVTGCRFEGNSAGTGGGMSNSESAPLVNDCTFNGNLAFLEGGGVNNTESEPNLTDCAFNANTAFSCGGGMYNDASPGTVKRCEFIANSANNGGGLQNDYSDMMISNCIFAGNAARDGTAIQNCSAHLTITNCTFSQNIILNNTGEILNQANRPGIKYENIFPYDPNEPVDSNQIPSSSFECLNCIFWESESTINSNGKTSIIVEYSNIQGDWPGLGNIDEDPLFADPNNGDYHLKSQAGRWDSYGNSWPYTVSGIGWVIDDVTSPCIDTGDPNSSISDEPEPNGGRINMGAYGGTTEASKSPLP